MAGDTLFCSIGLVLQVQCPVIDYVSLSTNFDGPWRFAADQSDGHSVILQVDTISVNIRDSIFNHRWEYLRRWRWIWWQNLSSFIIFRALYLYCQHGQTAVFSFLTSCDWSINDADVPVNHIIRSLNVESTWRIAVGVWTLQAFETNQKLSWLVHTTHIRYSLLCNSNKIS